MQQNKFPAWKEWFLAILAGLSFLIVLLYPLWCVMGEEWTPEEQELYTAWQKDEVIRLHVVANSNSTWDQAVKLYVRDAIIQAFNDRLRMSGNKSMKEIYDFLCTSAEEFQMIAEKALAQMNVQHSVQVQAGVLHLPAKQYGKVVLPEGSYKALRITIGAGQGKNWWCVLFPQLCLALSEEAPKPLEQIRWEAQNIFKWWLLNTPASALHREQNML